MKQSLWKRKVDSFLKKKKKKTHTFTIQQSNSIFRIHLEKIKTYVHTSIITEMFLAELLIKSKKPGIIQMSIYWTDKPV